MYNDLPEFNITLLIPFREMVCQDLSTVAIVVNVEGLEKSALVE